MVFRENRAGAVQAALLFAALLLSGGTGARAQQPDGSLPDGAARRTSSFRPALPSDERPHPLSAVIDYARKEQRYLQQTVNDFTCRLVKRERIAGLLQDYQYINMDVREAIVAGNRVARPFAIYLHFLGPESVAGRKIVFVEGQNDGKMLVRNGGRRFEYLVTRLDPNGRTARDETLVPITDIGFTRMLGKMIEVLERHRAADPDGDNTRAVRLAGAKINRRPCTLIRVTHPRRAAGLEFHRANVFVDDQLHVPVRVDYSDWPKASDGQPPLIAEYTYTELQLNVNLPDAAFSRGRLRSRRD